MIRRRQPEDDAAIRTVHEAAFPTALEADLVERLTADGDAVLSLVADEDGRLVGHVLLSRMAVSGGARQYRALGLAPVGVLPRCQRSGIGGALIDRAIETARDAGEELVFLVGEPAYYRRFGFSAEAAAPFASPYAGEYFMALPLRADVTLPAQGEAAYARAFSAFEAQR